MGFKERFAAFLGAGAMAMSGEAKGTEEPQKPPAASAVENAMDTETPTGPWPKPEEPEQTISEPVSEENIDEDQDEKIARLRKEMNKSPGQKIKDRLKKETTARKVAEKSAPKATQEDPEVVARRQDALLDRSRRDPSRQLGGVDKKMEEALARAKTLASNQESKGDN